MELDVNERAPGGDGVARRGLLGVSLGVAAAAVVPSMAVGGTTVRAAAPELPLQPTDADIPLLVAAQGAELAARDVYDAALATEAFDESTTAVLAFIRESHESYGQSLAGMLGRDAPSVANATIAAEIAAGLGSSANEHILALHGLESRLVTTHTDLLGMLASTKAAGLLASVQTVEARFGTVLADLAGIADLNILLAADDGVSFVSQG